MRLVPPPADDAAPERKALEGYSRRDAAKIAPFHNLQFDDPGSQPDRDISHLAERALAATGNKISAATCYRTKKALCNSIRAYATFQSCLYEKW